MADRPRRKGTSRSKREKIVRAGLRATLAVILLVGGAAAYSTGADGSLAWFLLGGLLFPAAVVIDLFGMGHGDFMTIREIVLMQVLLLANLLYLYVLATFALEGVERLRAGAEPSE